MTDLELLAAFPATGEAGMVVNDYRELLAQRGVQPAQLIRWGGTDHADSCFLIPHPDPRR